MTRLNQRQIELLRGFQNLHREGLISKPYHTPFGMSGLSLAGEGQPMSGLLRRGLVQEINRLYYITDAGLSALEEQSS